MRPMQRLKRRRTGFTLIEMLVVMSIVAVLGVLTALSMVAIGRRSSREGAAEDVMGILRQARLSAVDSGRGALVRISSVERTLYGLSSTIEAAWHFEEVDPISNVTPGAKRMDGTIIDTDVPPTLVVQPGAVGLCLDFDGTDDYVDCLRYPVYDPTDGIRLEAYVRPEGATADRELFGVIAKMDQAGGAGYSLGLEYRLSRDAYVVHGGFFINDPALPDGIHLASYYYDTATTTEEGMTLAGSRWHHVAMEFDGYEARLFVNGVLVDLDSYRASENTGVDRNPVWDPVEHTDKTFSTPARIKPARASNLEIGRAYYQFPPPPAYRYFQGRIDEPKLLSVAGGRRVALPERVPIVASNPVIHFDRQGHLDIAYHSGQDVSVGLGDPYQAAELAEDKGATLDLLTSNPFPPTGGIVMIANELIRYQSATGLTLTVSKPARVPVHPAGAQVLFARVVVVDHMGIVRRSR